MSDSNEAKSTEEERCPSGASEKSGRPKFHSQMSNVSFSSVAGTYSGARRSSGGTSPIAVSHIPNPFNFPRMSIRSILMNSPFSKRTKMRKGYTLRKSSKANNEAGIDVQGSSITFSANDKVNVEYSASLLNPKERSTIPTADSTLSKSPSSSKMRTSPETYNQMAGTSSSSTSPYPNHPTTSNDSLTDSPQREMALRAIARASTSSDNDKLKECPLCLQELESSKFTDLLTCNHSSCFNCMKQYLIVEITESRVSISCPQCHQLMHPSDIHQILNNSILSYKYEDFMLRRVLAMDPDTRWCPAPDCGYAVVASGCASCPKLKCERPGCGSFFCYHCKADWHPNQTCDMARAQRFPNVPFSSLSYLHDIQNSDVKSCPRCQVLIVKMDDGSCNHMTCSVCSAEFCWLCMKEISDLHYLSPSGCTYWGKKPWSRKKVIMWQLGTLVGAPVGIALLAGLAVPAMIIGFPIWVGKRLYSHLSTRGKYKRNLAIVGGVTASALLSPLLAGLAVSIGVLILLAYVYGVVPISLCRSGGCGVTTSATGVRIAFDDENDVVIGIPGRQSGEPNTSIGANPSIGEACCGASLSAESAAHLLGGESDRESASNTAIAPASLTGSIASSCLSRNHRIDMRTDLLHGNRSLASVDTHSSVTSDRSNQLHMDMENASMRALAGSLLHYKLQESECESLSGRHSRGYVTSDSVSGVVEGYMASGGIHTPYPHHNACGGDATSVHSGVDVMRLDSVSAIIKAKGVTFTDTDDEITQHDDVITHHNDVITHNNEVITQYDDVISHHNDVIAHHNEVITQHDEVITHHDYKSSFRGSSSSSVHNSVVVDMPPDDMLMVDATSVSSIDRLFSSSPAPPPSVVVESELPRHIRYPAASSHCQGGVGPEGGPTGLLTPREFLLTTVFDDGGNDGAALLMTKYPSAGGSHFTQHEGAPPQSVRPKVRVMAPAPPLSTDGGIFYLRRCLSAASDIPISPSSAPPSAGVGSDPQRSKSHPKLNDI